MKAFLLLLLTAAMTPVFAQHVVINEVYGAGGNAGAAFKNDFVELFNPEPAPVSLAGWSVQYASATSTGAWQVAALSGTIQPGRFYLLQLGAGSGNGQDLPAADAIGTIAMAATAGKVALVNTSAALNGACPSGIQIIDRIGYGASANCFEGAGPTVAPSASLSVARKVNGVDTDHNALDFHTTAPSPQNGLPVSQSITFDPLSSRVYGTSPFELTAASSSGLPISFMSSNVDVASVSGSVVTIHHAGVTTITASQSGNALYHPAVPLTQTLQVDKAQINAKANDVTRAAGQPNPTFTISYTGFAPGDGPVDIDTPPLATTAGATTAPGTYTIMLEGGSDDNYFFSLMTGVLTVTANQSAPGSFVMMPANNAAGIQLPVTLMAKPIKTTSHYTIQVSQDPSFNSVLEQTGGYRQVFSSLEYNKTYYARVMTNLSSTFGAVTQFSTGSPDQFTFITWPTPATQGVPLSPKLVSSQVIGATLYTIEVSASQDFSGPTQVRTGGRSQWFYGLSLNTMYHVRVRTDMSPSWGPVTTFRTGGSSSLCQVTSPVNQAVNVSWLPVIQLTDLGSGPYAIQLSKTSDFSSAITLSGSSNKFQLTAPLEYNTTYFVRASCANGSWGAVKTFTTGSPVDYSFVRIPNNGATDVSDRTTLVCNLVPGATSYTISVSTDMNFLPPAVMELTSSRHVIPVKLMPSTHYYWRVKTNLTPDWGMVGSLTTADVIMIAGGGQASGRVMTDDTEAKVHRITQLGREPAAYPNPFSDSFTLKLPEDTRAYSFRVMDMLGRENDAGELEPGSTVSLGQNLVPGVYLLILRSGVDLNVIKIVKK